MNQIYSSSQQSSIPAFLTIPPPAPTTTTTRRSAWRVALLCGFSMLAVFAGSAMAAGKPTMPKVNLGSEVRGEAAVEALGTNLPGVAAHYRMSPEKLKEILAKDHTSRLDRDARVFYVENTDEATTSTGNPLPAGVAPYPLSQTFTLHSRPGSKRVIYLDFDGHTVTNSAWNSGATIVAKPYDTDGNPAAFGTDELTTIQRVWVRVSEDYATFDVDVTTQDPGAAAIERTSSTDEYYGSRAVITVNDFYTCNCGGVAYLGTYDWYDGANPGKYQPAWVFDSNWAEGVMEETISHEVGHNLGLNHDGTASSGYYWGHGTGTMSWGPIMGAAFDRGVTQWSKGEYPGANNFEDDFTVIQSNGALLLADDVGNSMATSGSLGGSSSNGMVNVNRAGLIETRSDVDVFGFVTGGGNVSFTVQGSALGSNLDVLAELRDANGNVVASSNPAAELSATISKTLPAGTYYLSVDGIGFGDPATTGYTDYASVGEYHVKGSYSDVGAQPPRAALTAQPTSGTAPLAVSFDASLSTDPDSSIASYNWNFGDGTSATGRTTSHTYTTAGSFTAVLTVMDSQGLTSTASTVITVSATQTVSVRSIMVSSAYAKGAYTCTASVGIRNGSGANVGGAYVSGSWSGTVAGSVSGSTASNGVATIKSAKTKYRGTCTYTVSGVSSSGYVYQPSANVVTKGSVTY